MKVITSSDLLIVQTLEACIKHFKFKTNNTYNSLNNWDINLTRI